MLGKRRLLDTVDSLMNWLFGLLVLFVVLGYLTFVFETDISLFKLLQIIVNLFAGIEILIFIIEFVLSLTVWATDYNFDTKTMLWAFCRTVLSTVLVLSLNLLNKMFESGLNISLSINQ